MNTNKTSDQVIDNLLRTCDFGKGQPNTFGVQHEELEIVDCPRCHRSHCIERNASPFCSTCDQSAAQECVDAFEPLADAAEKVRKILGR